MCDVETSISSIDSPHSRNPPISTEPKLCTLDYFIPICITLHLIGKGDETKGVATRGGVCFLVKKRLHRRSDEGGVERSEEG